MKGKSVSEKSIVLIGAGSTVFTPGLMTDLASSRTFDGWTVHLVDLNGAFAGKPQNFTAVRTILKAVGDDIPVTEDDLDMDEVDFKAGRKIECPVLLLWGATGGVGRHHHSMAIWPRYAADISGGKALPCGHYLSEEAPDETYRELREFFTAKA